MRVCLPERLAGTEVETVAGRQKIELTALTHHLGRVVDRDVAGADHLEVVATNHDGGVLVEADSQQLRVCFDDLDEIEALLDIGVDGIVTDHPGKMSDWLERVGRS